MTKKAIYNRKIHRARKALNKAREEYTDNYTAILFADLRLMALCRERRLRYPRPLPKFSYIFKGELKWE